MVRRTWVLLASTIALTLGLAACGSAPSQGPAPSALGTRPAGRPLAAAPVASGPLSTATPSGRGVTILAPLSGPNAERGQALVRAAQIALAEPGSPALDVRDTGGTPEGAAAAASAAIGAGAGLIIGPLTTGETAAAAGPARAAGVPVLAFTSDPAQAQPGVWVLGITPTQQVRRVVGAMIAQGKQRFAAVLPSNEFGQAMGAALTQVTSSAGLQSPSIHTYDGSMASLNNAVRDVAEYGARRGPLDAQIKAARARHDAEGRKRAAELTRQSIPPPSFDGLLLAATGDALSTIATLLPYYDIDPPAVRVLGPALWASANARGGAGLNGAYYAAPDPAARSGFDQRYTSAVGSPASGLADFAYDAAAIARVLAQGEGFSVAALCRPEGFAGVDGLLALQPDGTVRRGLALFELQRGGPVMIEPAPDSLAAPGI